MLRRARLLVTTVVVMVALFGGSVAQATDTFRFHGSGYGHGIGMSQWGAQGMALGGANYEQILKHYYTGIQLTNVGGA